MEELDNILDILPGHETLTPQIKQSALSRSLIPDTNGVWPGQSGYEPTYDPWFAATLLITFLSSQGGVSSASSEGTSVTVEPTDWDALRSYLRYLSPIVRATGSQVLTRVPIPDVPHVYRADMGASYDADTDIS